MKIATKLRSMRWRPSCLRLSWAIALAWFGQGEVHAQGPQIIPKDKLPEFLRSDSPDQFTWRAVFGPDFAVYYGTANVPLSGSVGFYVGGAPRRLLPTNVPTFRSKLGRFRVKWHRTPSDDGLIHQETIISVGESGQFKAHVWVGAQNEAELNSLVSAAGRLPIFAPGALPASFTEIDSAISQERRRGRILWGIWWAVVLVSGWFADRLLCRRKSSAAARVLTFSINVVAWIPITIGLIMIIGSVGIDSFRKANGWLLFGEAAVLALIGFLLATALFLVARVRTRRMKAVAVAGT